MDERRREGFRVKPSFAQALGYIQEGEPLTLDLPNRNASIYTSSHFYLDDYPNAPEPLSDVPMPHTTLNPAAVFETADEGYEGVPFPRPAGSSRGHPSCPTATTGAAIPGRPCATTDYTGRPHEGERHSGRGGDRRGRRGGRGGSGAERVGEPDDAGPARWRRLAGPHAENPEAPTGTGPPTGRSACAANHRTALGSGAPAAQRAGQRAAEVERAAARDIESLFASQQLAEAEASASEGFATAAEAAAGAAEAATAAEAGGGALALLGEGALATAGTVGAAAGGLAVAGAGAALVWARRGASKGGSTRLRTSWAGALQREAARTATRA